MKNHLILFASFFAIAFMSPEGSFSQNRDQHEKSDFDGLPHFPEEDLINRAIFSAAPLGLTVCGCAMAVEAWTPTQMLVAAGIGAIGTGISYRHQFVWLPKRTNRISPKAAMASLGIGLATAACAAIVAKIIH